MHIPINEAIRSGAWFKCKCKTVYAGKEFWEFRIRILDFYKVDISEIDDIQESDIDHDLSQGNLWILKTDLVNLNKEEESTSSIIGEIKIMDGDEFVFSNVEDYHICGASQYGKKHGLSKFRISFLVPKIKYSGGILFFLPCEECPPYSVSVDGSFEEI